MKGNSFDEHENLIDEVSNRIEFFEVNMEKFVYKNSNDTLISE